MSSSEREKLSTAAKEERKRRARDNLLLFTKYTFPGNYRVNWHHRILADYLDRFVRKEIRRLIVTMPPRMGKSQLISRQLPGYIFGRDPDSRIIACSYSAPLAASMSRDAKRVIGSEAYRELFPDTRLNQKAVVTDTREDAKNAVEEWEIVGRRGAYRCAGVGGSITGFGGDFLLVDDPVKNREEAESATFQRRLWGWYNDDLLTRLEEPGCILLVATRWHERDLIGQVLKESKENPEADQWTVIEFPAIKDEEGNQEDPREIGEPLWPGYFQGKTEDPIPEKELTERALKRYRAIQSSNAYGWAALYQCRPAPKEGAVIKLAWCQQLYKALPDEPGEWIQSWDCRAGGKSETSSYAVGQVWFRPHSSQGRLYFVDQVRGRWSTPETIEAIKALTRKWPLATLKLVEDKADGRPVIAMLEKEIVGLVPVNPKGCKEARLEAVSPLFQANNVWLPDPSIAPWIDGYISELTTFPSAANDDQVDTTSQALNHFMNAQAQVFDIVIPGEVSSSSWRMQ